jgi:hypothetical protein
MESRPSRETVTPITGRCRIGRRVFAERFVEVREMLLMNTESRKAGGNVVTYFLTSSVLESLVSWNPACRVRGRGVAKVP